MARFAVSAAVLATLGVSVARAHAEVEVPGECGSLDELEAALRRLTGDSELKASAVRVAIEPKAVDGMFTLRVVVDDETRTLRDVDCRTLFRSAVVIAAASLRVVEAPAAKPVEPAKREDRRSSEPSQSFEQDPPEPPGSPPAWHASLAAGGGVTLGLGPRPAPRVELVMTIERGMFGGLAGAHFLAETTKHTDDGHGVAIMTAGGKVAALLIPARFLRLAFGGEVGFLSGQGSGSTPVRLRDSAWGIAVTADAGFVPVQTGRLRLEFVLGGHAALLRPQFEIVGFGEVYRVPRLGGSGVIRLAFTFL